MSLLPKLSIWVSCLAEILPTNDTYCVSTKHNKEDKQNNKESLQYVAKPNLNLSNSL